MSTTSFTDGVTLTAASWFNDVDSTAYSVLTGVAGTNTITATGPANYTLSTSRTPVWFIPAATNTGATTLNITPSGGSALTAKNVYFNGAACVGGEIVSGVPTAVYYDGTQFNIVGPTLPATQTQQEAGSATSVFVSPGRQQYHPSAAKGWIKAAVDGTIFGSYNVTSITDSGAGQVAITWGTDFSSTNYCAVASLLFDFAGAAASTLALTVRSSGFAAGSTSLNAVRLSDYTDTDPSGYFCAAFGDQ